MHALVLPLLVLVLGGCVEYRESLVLERDESGTVVMAVGVNEALLRAADIAETGMRDLESVPEALRALDGLQVIESRTETQDGTRWLHVVLAFESLAALDAINRIERYGGLFGRMTLTESPAGQRVLTRTIRADLHPGAGESLLASLVAPMLGRYAWSYEMRFPARVLASNGETELAERDATIVRWRFSLRDLVTGPQEMRATFVRTGVGPAGIGVGAALMLIGIAVARFMQRRRRRAGPHPHVTQ